MLTWSNINQTYERNNLKKLYSTNFKKYTFIFLSLSPKYHPKRLAMWQCKVQQLPSWLFTHKQDKLIFTMNMSLLYTPFTKLTIAIFYHWYTGQTYEYTVTFYTSSGPTSLDDRVQRGRLSKHHLRINCYCSKFWGEKMYSQPNWVIGTILYC